MAFVETALAVNLGGSALKGPTEWWVNKGQQQWSIQTTHVCRPEQVCSPNFVLSAHLKTSTYVSTKTAIILAILKKMTHTEYSTVQNTYFWLNKYSFENYCWD